MKNKDIFTFRDAEKQAGPVAFSTMLKPAGSACNLDCHYCYYLDKAVQYGGRQAVMSDELLELYVKQYICANEVDTVQFCWHGGEPLLLGVDFYRRAMEFQRKYEQLEQQVRAQYPDLDAAGLKAMQLKQQLIQNLILENLIMQEAKRVGIVVTPVELRKLMKAVLRDKKAADGVLRVVLPVAVGNCVVRTMTVEELAAALR